MNRYVLFDTSILSEVTNPKQTDLRVKMSEWVQSLVLNQITIVVPEICDYELRRELIRGNKTNGIKRLDEFIGYHLYLPINSKVMKKAAQYWADARKQGKQTTDDCKLDADMILCAQANSLAGQGYNVEVATENLRHLTLFVVAKKWDQIC
ncbi:MAG: nucleic acid-binding protein [Acidobacteria bacterium]|nr:nucleic acid-binding protein [Acidobacteriota bacterium]